MPAAGAAHALRRRLVLGRCLSRAMVRGSFPRAHTSLQNALKPHFVGTPSSRGLHRRASLSSRPLLPPRRPGRGGWRRWGPSPDRATTAAPGLGAKDRRSRSWGTTPYRVVKGFGFSDWWCVLSGRPRTDEPVGGPIPSHPSRIILRRPRCPRSGREAIRATGLGCPPWPRDRRPPATHGDERRHAHPLGHRARRSPRRRAAPAAGL